MQGGPETKELTRVECAPFLQRLILEDPDPSSPYYIPKAPPRNYETLSKALEAGKYKDQTFEPLPPTMEASRGVNMRDRQQIKHQRDRLQMPEASLKVPRQVADYNQGLDPFSMGGSPFGGGGSSDYGGDPFGGGDVSPFGGGDVSPFGGGEPSPFGGRGEWDQEEEDPLSGIGEPLYPDIPGLKEKADAQYKEAKNMHQYLKDQEANEDDDEENEDEGQVGTEDDDDNEEMNESDQDDSKFPFSTPMYEAGDEQIMQDAIKLREKDGIPDITPEGDYEDDKQTASNEQGAVGARSTNSVAKETGPGDTGSEVVPEGVPPRRKLKEKFMRDREQLERMMNAQGDSIYRRGDEPLPGRPPTNVPDGHQPPGSYPPPRFPRETRIMSGQEIKQQMAMQKLARAALTALSKKGGPKRGKVKVMFM